MTRARRTPHKPTQADHLAAVHALLDTGLWHPLPALIEVCQPRGRTAVTLALDDMQRNGWTLEERVEVGVVHVRAVAPAARPDTPAAHPNACAVPLHGPADDGPGVVVLVDELPHPFGPEPTLPAPRPDDHSGQWEPGPHLTPTEMYQPFDPSGDCIEDESDRPFDDGSDTLDATVMADVDTDLGLCPGGCGELGGECSCPVRPKAPGPSSRCAVCDVSFARHADRAHPFAPKRRGPAPGPSSRCAICDVSYKRHEANQRNHPFAPRKRGPAPGPRQRRTPGPIVDVASEARIERAGGPRLAPVGAEGEEERRMRERAAPSRYRFWSPSLGLGWLTWGEVCPSTPTRFEPDDGAHAIEWIWTECGNGKAPDEDPPRTSADLAEWLAWEHFTTAGGEALIFRREGPPAPRIDAPPPAPAPCTPSSCHWQRIHDPARVAESELPPLCEEHRGRWRAARGGGAVDGQRREER